MSGSNIILLNDRHKKPVKGPTPAQQEFAEMLQAFEDQLNKSSATLVRVAERYKALPDALQDSIEVSDSKNGHRLVRLDAVLEFIRGYKL